VSAPTAVSPSALPWERAIAATATTSILGLALVGTGDSLLGTVLSLGGLGALMFAIHRYGRLGAESPARER
jgi:hypothetical protein